jgi:hypothetical protein
MIRAPAAVKSSVPGSIDLMKTRIGAFDTVLAR